MVLIEGATRFVVLGLNVCLWELTQVQIYIGRAKNAVCWCLAIHVVFSNVPDVYLYMYVIKTNKKTKKHTLKLV